MGEENFVPYAMLARLNTRQEVLDNNLSAVFETLNALPSVAEIQFSKMQIVQVIRRLERLERWAGPAQQHIRALEAQNASLRQALLDHEQEEGFFCHTDIAVPPKCLPCSWTIQ